MDSLKKRKPILAFLFSLVTPGLGQIYNGQLKKGLFYLVGFLLVYVVFSFLLLTFYGMICYLIIMLGFSLFILLDALLGAVKLKAIALKSYNKWYIYLIIFLLGSVVIRPLLGWTIKNNIARAYRTPSSTMKPALLAGDHLIANMRI
jgi:signal peptidase I